MQDSGDACVLLELCNKTQAVVFAKSQPRPQPRLQVPQDMKCEVCTLAVAFIKPYVDSATTEVGVCDREVVGVCGREVVGGCGREVVGGLVGEFNENTVATMCRQHP